VERNTGKTRRRRWRSLHAGYEAIPATALVCRKQYIYKSPKRFGSSHCPCPPHHQPENATAPPRLCARPPVPDGENARRDGSNFTAGLCQHHNNTLARPGSPGPNPITHPCDTETDSAPDPELASPWTFSDILELCPETYTYTAKRYTYTMMRRVRVRVRVSVRVSVRVRVRGRLRMVADPPDHCLNRGRGRNRNRDRSLP
jgi:hypothetical protein